jgi:hypothetical protein
VNVSADFQRLLPVLAIGVVALAAVVLLARGLGGGGEGSANQVIDEAFTKEARSGLLSVRLTFALQNGATGKSQNLVEFVVSGPGQDVRPGGPSKADFTVTERLVGRPDVSLALLSTGTEGYLKHAGRWYRMSDRQFQRVFEPGKDQTLVESLGFDPRKWIVAPRKQGVSPIGGVEANHVVADVNTDAMLADMDFFGGQGESGQAEALVGGARKEGRLNLFAGKDDGVLRKLEVVSRFLPPQGGSQLSGTLRFELGLGAVNQPQKIVAPRHASPPAGIAAIPARELGSYADDLHASGSAPPRGREHGRRAGKRREREGRKSAQSYVACVERAAGLAALDKCQSVLP